MKSVEKTQTFDTYKIDSMLLFRLNHNFVVFIFCICMHARKLKRVIWFVSPLSLLWLSLGPDQSDCVILYKIYSQTHTNRLCSPSLAKINWMVYLLCIRFLLLFALPLFIFVYRYVFWPWCDIVLTGVCELTKNRTSRINFKNKIFQF